ncbi:MAG TPA: J domain-containing protein [Aliidongia sp.]|nr:J domain-containing protein [Aliidongia sp.]
MWDPYATLQVDRRATQDEIKRAYRKLAKELHPDLHPNNPASARRFKDITAAYDVLSDETKRRRYDHEIKQAAAASEQRSSSRFEEGLDAFFGGRSWGYRNDGTSGGPRRRGADIYQSLTVTFVEAAQGARKRIVVNDERALDVTVPPLTTDGQSLRLKGQGGLGQNGGLNGDVFVEITVEPHPLFTTKDRDIHMELPVTVPEAVLGATVTVPTVAGLVQLKIPKGSNTGSVLRLKGRGLAGPGTVPGDQYVTLKVILPDARDPDFAALVEAWAKRHDYSVRPPHTN